jgi:hypothetical protein
MAKERKSKKTTTEQSALAKAIADSLKENARDIAESVLNEAGDLLKEEISVHAGYHFWGKDPDTEPMVSAYLGGDHENPLCEIPLRELTHEAFSSDCNVLLAVDEEDAPPIEHARTVLKTLQAMVSDFEKECKEAFGEAWESE